MQLWSRLHAFGLRHCGRGQKGTSIKADETAHSSYFCDMHLKEDIDYLSTEMAVKKTPKGACEYAPDCDAFATQLLIEATKLFGTILIDLLYTLIFSLNLRLSCDILFSAPDNSSINRVKF